MEYRNQFWLIIKEKNIKGVACIFGMQASQTESLASQHTVKCIERYYTNWHWRPFWHWSNKTTLCLSARQKHSLIITMQSEKYRCVQDVHSMQENENVSLDILVVRTTWAMVITAIKHYSSHWTITSNEWGYSLKIQILTLYQHALTTTFI